MRKRIKNSLQITCEGVDLTTVSNIEFYLRQDRLFFQYSPEVISPSEMLVEVPFEDAMKLISGQVQMQFAFTDAEGNPQATEIETAAVGDLLKEAGYAPI